MNRFTGTKKASILIDGGFILWVKTGCKGGTGCLLSFWKNSAQPNQSVFSHSRKKAEGYKKDRRYMTEMAVTGYIRHPAQLPALLHVLDFALCKA